MKHFITIIAIDTIMYLITKINYKEIESYDRYKTNRLNEKIKTWMREIQNNTNLMLSEIEIEVDLINNKTKGK